MLAWNTQDHCLGTFFARAGSGRHLSGTGETVKFNPTKMQKGQGLNRPSKMVQQRQRVRHTETFEEQLSKEAAPFKEVAAKTPSEKYDREPDLKRVEQAEIASNINKWLGSRICGKAC